MLPFAVSFPIDNVLCVILSPLTVCVAPFTAKLLLEGSKKASKAVRNAAMRLVSE
jgi:hypothetical protein